MVLKDQKTKPPRNMRGGLHFAERGFILITVLWLGLGIAAVASFLTVSARFQARQASAVLADAMQQVTVLDAAAAWTVSALDTEAASMSGLGPEPVWREFGGQSVSIVVANSAEFLDINGDDVPRIAEAMINAGLPPATANTFASRIVDFRDPDDLRSLDGAEASDYRAAGLPPPRNAPFLAPSELSLVFGATPELLAALGGQVLALEPPKAEAPQKVQFIGGRPTDVTGRRGIKTLHRPRFVITLEIAGGAGRSFTF